MSDLGGLLKKAREQRGLTLDDVQDATKIRKRYLEAIESGDYKVLPGSFYVRAFVKTYAETVGLDAEEVLRLYHRELPQPPSAESSAAAAARAEPIRRPERRIQHNDRLGKVAVTMLMWAFPILIAVVIYVYFSYNKNPGPDVQETNKITEETATTMPSSDLTPTPSVTPSSTPSATPSPSPVSVTLTKTVRGTKYYEVSNAEGAKLELNVTGRCWVGVRKGGVSGEKEQWDEIKGPELLSYDLTEPYFIKVGRADNISITVGGVAVDDGDRSSPAKLLITPAAAETAN